jgi:hypothetical protein
MKCKNTNCLNETIGKKLYCSLSCRNKYVNTHLRDYSKCSDTFDKKRKDKEKEYMKNPKYCKQCVSIIPFNKINDNKTFCNRSCSASYNNMNRDVIWNDKIRDGVNRYINENGYFGVVLIKKSLKQNKELKYCLNCKSSLTKNKFYCNRKCEQEYKRTNVNDFVKYKLDCQFKFNLSDFPNEYDFSLIEEYGWYSPKNKKNNLFGVSRDHIFSIREGYNLGIDSRIISHPANCQLLPHSQNVSKHKKCSISLEDLLTKIENFNKKYNYS